MATLELHRRTDGLRYYLDGEPVHAGEILEAQLSNGRWEHVRFECFWDHRDSTVELSFIRGGKSGRLLSLETSCRWPIAGARSRVSRNRYA